jgi:hypothetical protein
MNLIILIMAANFLTLVLTIIAAIKFPSWSYQFIGLVALGAFLFALYQFKAGSYHPATLILTTLLNGLMAMRVLVNRRKFKRR